MDALSLFWVLGQTLSILAIVAGAVICLFASEVLDGGQAVRPSSRIPRREVHPPLNHRLLLEAEW